MGTSTSKDFFAEYNGSEGGNDVMVKFTYRKHDIM